jgi:hypothetical protein
LGFTITPALSANEMHQPRSVQQLITRTKPGTRQYKSLKHIKKQKHSTEPKLITRKHYYRNEENICLMASPKVSMQRCHYPRQWNMRPFSNGGRLSKMKILGSKPLQIKT